MGTRTSRRGPAGPSRPTGPYAFVVQVNFSDVPPLPGFPGAGLLQWFVEPSDSFGLTFDRTAGAVGFHVRWWESGAGGSSVTVDAPLPPLPDGGHTPVTAVEPRALTFRPAPSLPEWDGLPEDAQYGYAEFARRPYLDRSGPSIGQVGGFASFVQWDPRPARGDQARNGYAAAGAPGWPLLVELESAGAWEWGDVGVAHLFGDPTAVGRGDLSSVRYHWDCH